MSETITDFNIHQNNHSDFMAWIDSFDNFFFNNSSNNLFIQLFVSHPVIKLVLGWMVILSYSWFLCVEQNEII